MDLAPIRDTAEAVKGIVEAVPVYQDAIQPAAKQIGKGLETAAKTIHIALAPIAALVWGYERIADYLLPGLAERFRSTAPDTIVTPSPMVVGPAVEALRYAGHESALRDLFVNLIATSMDRNTALHAHPAFVEVLKQITPDEARMLSVLYRGQNFPILSVDKRHVVFRNGKEVNVVSWVLRRFSLLPYSAGCVYPDLGPAYLENLERLRVGIIPSAGLGTSGGIMAGDAYKELENHPVVVATRASIDATAGEASQLDYGVFRVSAFGRQFLNAVVRQESGG